MFDGNHDVVVIYLDKIGEEVGCRGVEGKEGGVDLAGTTDDGVEEVVGSDDSLVHIDLPVHEAATDDKFLDTVDTFLVDYELVIVNVEHRDYAVGADNAFADTGEEAVASEIVEAVHVELRGDKLVEEVFVVLIGEYGNGSL